MRIQPPTNLGGQLDREHFWLANAVSLVCLIFVLLADVWYFYA